MTCKNPNCHNQFHACSSCSLGYDWEYSYCSEKCFLENNKDTINKIISFKDGLTPSQLETLQYFFNEVDDELFGLILNQD